MTAFDKPIPSIWDGEAWRPVGNYWPVYANKVLVVGQVYPLVVEHERDMNSHRHYFAAITEVWKNLPDAMALQFETAEILRKHALIMTGHFHERKLALESRAAALRAYEFMKAQPEVLSRAAREQSYAVYAIVGPVLVERRARSQSIKAMGRGAFMRSKWDTLNWCADLIGIDVSTLHKEAGQAA